MIARSMTAEEFAEHRVELPDGQWAELIAGEPVLVDPPTPEHGTVVMNVSRQLSAWIDRTRCGYACFHHGLLVSRRPDTVLRPAISYFITGDRWQELDRDCTENSPVVVIDVVSSRSRQLAFPARLSQLRERGVAAVWGIDPRDQSVTVHTTSDARRFVAGDVIRSEPAWSTALFPAPILAGFSITVDDVFANLKW